MRKSLLLLVFAVVAALALGACGSSGGGDEGEIEEAIETAATSTNPSKCTEVETQKFLEQNTRESGQAAVKKCEEEAPEENAESVKISNIEVEGEEADAEVAITGGGFDGQTLELNLVKEEGSWKVNEATGFAKLDNAKLARALEGKLAESEEVSESLASCVVEGVEEASQSEVEELLLSGSGEPLEELAEECE